MLGWRATWSHTAGASIFHQTNQFRCPAPTLPDPTNPLSRPARPLLLLCNFASDLKIDRRLEQTLFGGRKQQNSYKMCLRSRRKFALETTTKWDVPAAPCWPSTVEVFTFPSCCVWYEPPKRGVLNTASPSKAHFSASQKQEARIPQKQICTMLRLSPLSPLNPLIWIHIQGCILLQILPYKNSQQRLRSEPHGTIWGLSTVTADRRVLLAAYGSKDPPENTNTTADAASQEGEPAAADVTLER